MQTRNITEVASVKSWQKGFLWKKESKETNVCGDKKSPKFNRQCLFLAARKWLKHFRTEYTFLTKYFCTGLIKCTDLFWLLCFFPVDRNTGGCAGARSHAHSGRPERGHYTQSGHYSHQGWTTILSDIDISIVKHTYVFIEPLNHN